MVKAAAVWACLILGVLLEQHLWDETMTGSTNEWTATAWGECEGCQEYKSLLDVEGHGWLCFGCEWDMVVADMKAGAEHQAGGLV